MQRQVLYPGEIKGRHRAALAAHRHRAPADFQSAFPASRSKAAVPAGTDTPARFDFRVSCNKPRQVRRHESRYLLRTHPCGRDPADRWQFSIERIEAQSSSPMACRSASGHASRPRGPPRVVLDKLAAHPTMLDLHFPTQDGRALILSRYTQPAGGQQLILGQLKLALPPPRITATGKFARQPEPAPPL